MTTINITAPIQKRTIPLGLRGENEITQVVFDYSQWVTEFGNGVVTLLVRRSKDAYAYPVVVTTERESATWLVTATDTAFAGSGEAEFSYTVDGKIAKSVVFKTTVLPDIGEPSETPPDPYETWLDTLTEIGTEAQQAAQDAEAARDDVLGMRATAETLNPHEQATANYSGGLLTIGVPRGMDGANVWWSERVYVSQTSHGEYSYSTRVIDMHSKDGAIVAVGDFVYAPESGYYYDNPIDTLFVVSRVRGATIIELEYLCSIKGEDGYSPTVTVTEIPGGHQVTITDADGDHTFNVMDGSGSGSSSVSWALYGETTPASIKFLVDLGNAVFCSYSGRVYSIVKTSVTSALFVSVEENDVYWLSASTSTASITWSNGVFANYVKPSGGIPKTDLASAVQTSLGKADSAYQLPSGGIPKTDLASSVQTSLGKADTAYQKPANGIPAEDLASGVIPTVPVASDDTPQALGTAAAGSSAKFSRADHVHDKPTYSKSDVGLGNVDNVQQYSENNPPPYPVTSVNGNTGAVTLSIPSTAGDVGAIAAPSSPATGAFLVWSGSAWVAQTLATWQASSY